MSNGCTSNETRPGHEKLAPRPVQTFDIRKQPNLNIAKYPKWIGRKFEPDGTVIGFAGNTVLSRIRPASSLHAVLSDIHHKLLQSEFASLFAVLPPSSYHVTLMEGICNSNRSTASWPRDLSIQASLAECNELFRKKLNLASHVTRATCATSFQMIIEGWRPLENGISLRVVPATPTDASRLRLFREYLSDSLQLRHPKHESYDFHISLTYSLQYFSQDEEKRILALLQKLGENLPRFIELGLPELCTFDDMFAFHHLCFVEAPISV
ncbi:hypothetical protein B7463_g11069, partial [Scytalidium lignicola]